MVQVHDQPRRIRSLVDAEVERDPAGGRRRADRPVDPRVRAGRQLPHRSGGVRQLRLPLPRHHRHPQRVAGPDDPGQRGQHRLGPDAVPQRQAQRVHQGLRVTHLLDQPQLFLAEGERIAGGVE
ncbi:hypothetical protein GCM10027615_71070 [Plantactinospora veratri]